MNLAGMRAAVRTRTGYRSSDPSVPDEVVTDCINAALHHLETIADWSHLEATETLAIEGGTDNYTAGATTGGYVRTKSLTLVSGDALYEMSEVPINRIDENWGSNAIPVVWCDWGGQLILRPIPDQDYTITHRFIRSEDDLVDDDDVPLAPTVFHWGIVEYAGYLIYRRDSDERGASMANDAFVQWVNVLRDNRRRGSAPVVPTKRRWT